RRETTVAIVEQSQDVAVTVADEDFGGGAVEGGGGHWRDEGKAGGVVAGVDLYRGGEGAIAVVLVDPDLAVVRRSILHQNGDARQRVAGEGQSSDLARLGAGEVSVARLRVGEAGLPKCRQQGKT